MRAGRQNSIPNSSQTGTSNSNGQMLTEQVFEAIQELIIKGEFRPNQRLIEAELARKLGTSRTPVREALKRLEMTGYVSPNVSGGVIVADYSVQVQSLITIREALECMALELSCPTVTEDQMRKMEDYHKRIGDAIANSDIEQYVVLHGKFHEELYSACNNDRLKSLISIFRYPHFDRMLVRVQTERELLTVTKYHGEILEAVRKKNTNRAVRLLKRHFRYSLKIALRRL
jgi:DNA-binding GntR family transcriptional regulator